jgi:hypothetical protein
LDFATRSNLDENSSRNRSGSSSWTLPLQRYAIKPYETSRRFGVYLHLPIAQGDFTLEVFQHPTYGDCVLETGKLSIEPLRCLLGDFLFEAMMNSTYRRDEEARGKLVTSAVVILKDDNGDKRLRVKANFDAGAQIWNVMSLHSMGVLAPPS